MERPRYDLGKNRGINAPHGLYRLFTESLHKTLKAYLGKATGLSRAQLTRLIARWRESGTIRDRRGTPGKPYPRHYTPEDVLLLAETDRLHETLSGPAIRHVCRRQYQQYGDERYRRLAFISVGHLYRLRKTPAYQRRNRRFLSTQSVKAPTDPMMLVCESAPAS
ncbi:MAG: hypothetical protein OXN23_00035 [Gammaproteobacteria bacterium]|nr:hypothetical protein [Gammaproteobacteria bacterium]